MLRWFSVRSARRPVAPDLGATVSPEIADIRWSTDTIVSRPARGGPSDRPSTHVLNPVYSTGISAWIALKLIPCRLRTTYEITKIAIARPYRIPM